jgi:hypothetical protein
VKSGHAATAIVIDWAGQDIVRFPCDGLVCIQYNFGPYAGFTPDWRDDYSVHHSSGMNY